MKRQFNLSEYIKLILHCDREHVDLICREGKNLKKLKEEAPGKRFYFTTLVKKERNNQSEKLFGLQIQRLRTC